MAYLLLALTLGCEERPPQQPLPDDVESTWGQRPVAPTDTGTPGELARCEEEPCAPPQS